MSATQNLSHKAATLAGEASHWVSGNLVDILLATAAGIVIALILVAVRSLGCRLARRMESADPQWRSILARVVARTNLFFIIMCAAELVGEHAATPPALLRVIHVLFVVAAAIQAAIWARELVLGYVQHRAGIEEEHSTLGSAIGLIRLLVTVALFAIALILILSNLGVNVTGLIAGLGIGGIAIGLAAQGIFSDLFAALSIIFDKPFRRGDGVRVDGLQGTVENIGLKTTRIRALSGEQVVVSNAKLLEQQIRNFTNLEHRRFVLTFGLVYQTPPETCAAVPEMVRAIVEAQPQAIFVRCGMTAFGASSLDYELQFDVTSSDYEFAFAARSAVCLAILNRFGEEGIAFAYPTQTSFTAAPDGRFVLPYPPVQKVVREGREAVTPDESGGNAASARSDGQA
jgi:small-conductance mechanosensitive channel